jgi:NhaA family Na+:H+ antiporter
MSILHLVNDGLPTVFVLVVCLEVKREMTVGHSLGVFLAAAAAVRTGIAVKPAEYTWRQLAGAGALAGIGFTMSLFIAGQAFPGATEFSAAKIAVFGVRRDCPALGSFAPGAYRRGAAGRWHASIIARRRLCGIVDRRSFDDSAYRYDSSGR